MPVCDLISQRSVLIQPCNFRLIISENVGNACIAFNKLVNMCFGKNDLRLELLHCIDIYQS